MRVAIFELERLMLAKGFVVWMEVHVGLHARGSTVSAARAESIK